VNSALARILILVLFAVFGVLVGAVGAFMQAQRGVMNLGSNYLVLPWGTILMLVVLIVLTRVGHHRNSNSLGRMAVLYRLVGHHDSLGRGVALGGSGHQFRWSPAGLPLWWGHCQRGRRHVFPFGSAREPRPRNLRPFLDRGFSTIREIAQEGMSLK